MAKRNMNYNNAVFEDYFPSMVEKLGADGFMNELCKGFRMLMDFEKRVITLESLKKNSAVLGLQGVSDDELLCMLKEGDLDGDGCLNQMEFCVLMFRLSPDLMNRATIVIDDKTMIVFDCGRISLDTCKVTNLREALFDIRRLSSDISLAFPSKTLRSVKVSENLRWENPPTGFWKLNTDGSLVESTKNVATRGLIRDEKGCWIKGFSRNIRNRTITEAKLLALHE
ncbi:hypothetical protein BUALT_Bualt03G0068600 [Buddleja alternifolia]|uniref:EF-hand domain-containing protein n=1 Tax=Buddleja alternifolia TaxID=168488 RepID=A0AAV6XTW4_9LAMI|nr:hypothetical protein BUALT_Bualt03G0068600 [Buddleja alternifolia]